MNTANQQRYTGFEYLEQMHYYGTCIRFSRDLIRAQSASKALDVIRQCLENLNLTGYFRFLQGDTRDIKKFGRNVSRQVFRDLNHLKRCACTSEKICIQDEFIIIKTEMTFIFICRRDLDDEQVDKYQDVLAVIIDTIDSWLTNYLSRCELSCLLQTSLCELIESSSNLLDCHRFSSNELMSSMIVRFPLLGLDADQEEDILDTIKKTLNEHVGLLETQIEKNNALGDVLISSVDALSHADMGSDSESDNGGVDLF